MNTPIPLPPTADADAEPARLLQFELTTRITTQPLHYRSGDEDTAADSVYQLFKKTRTLLEEHWQAAAFETAALFLLNNLVRPYTARWHRWMTDGRLADERSRRQFRYELKQLQPRLRDFAELLGLLGQGPAGADRATAAFTALVKETPPLPESAELGGSFEAGIGHEIAVKQGELGGKLGKFATVEEVNAAEAAFILRRRAALGLATDGPGLQDATGLCLSGGGIRSATFCLGIVQVLARQGLMPQFDYLSTVSGGGYLGTFMTGILGNPKETPGSKAPAKPHAGKFSKEEIETAFADAFHDEDGRESAALRHLRNNSRYLLNGGAWGRVRAIGLIITGILTNILLLLPVPLGAVFGVLLLNHLGYWGANWPANFKHAANWPAHHVFLGILGVLGVLWLLLPAVRNFARGALPESGRFRFRTIWESLALTAGLGMLAAGVLVATPGLFHIVAWLRDSVAVLGPKVERWAASDTALTGVAAALPVIFGLFAGRLKQGKSKQVMTVLFALSGPLLGLAVFLLVGSRLLTPPVAKPAPIAEVTAASPPAAAAPAAAAPVAAAQPAAAQPAAATPAAAAKPAPAAKPAIASQPTPNAWDWRTVGLISLLLTLWGWILVDINEYSPHGYYRARLCECYLAVRGEERIGWARRLMRRLFNGRKRSSQQAAPSSKPAHGQIGARLRLPLSEMNATGAAPYHLLNTAANLPASHEPNLRGRDCDFYVFSREYCGGPVCGYVKTKTVEQLDPHVDLGTAMAISAAAASSNMGATTVRHLRFLITLLNVRLGYWLRNPASGLRRPGGAPGPAYLFRELTGWMHESTDYLNLSDGGHIENLALYELLRRRCKFIVVVDGGMEPGMECADLMLAQRYAEIDLGVRLELDVADLALSPDRRTRAYAIFGKIHYGTRGGQGADDLGWLVYIKLACTGAEPGYVVDYRRKNPDFPHQTTADQIYDEAQFEAYRRLGECAGESLFRGELAGVPVNPQTENTAANPRFKDKDLRAWFQTLADNLLPDNDAAFEAPATDV